MGDQEQTKTNTKTENISQNNENSIVIFQQLSDQKTKCLVELKYDKIIRQESIEAYNQIPNTYLINQTHSFSISLEQLRNCVLEHDIWKKKFQKLLSDFREVIEGSQEKILNFANMVKKTMQNQSVQAKQSVTIFKKELDQNIKETNELEKKFQDFYEQSSEYSQKMERFSFEALRDLLPPDQVQQYKQSIQTQVDKENQKRRIELNKELSSLIQKINIKKEISVQLIEQKNILVNKKNQLLLELDQREKNKTEISNMIDTMQKGGALDTSTNDMEKKQIDDLLKHRSEQQQNCREQRDRIHENNQVQLLEVNKQLSENQQDGDYATGYHFILICDRSGSMGNDTKKVVNCVENFLDERQKESVPITYSIYAFDDQVDQFANNQDIQTPLTKEFKNLHARGGTEFYQPIKAALGVTDMTEKSHTSILIFFTDGEGSGVYESIELLKNYKNQLKEKIMMFCIGFGSSFPRDTLTQFAVACNNSDIFQIDKRKFHYVQSSDSSTLEKAFQEIGNMVDYKTNSLKRQRLLLLKLNQEETEIYENQMQVIEKNFELELKLINEMGQSINQAQSSNTSKAIENLEFTQKTICQNINSDLIELEEVNQKIKQIEKDDNNTNILDQDIQIQEEQEKDLKQLNLKIDQIKGIKEKARKQLAQCLSKIAQQLAIAPEACQDIIQNIKKVVPIFNLYLSTSDNLQNLLKSNKQLLEEIKELMDDFETQSLPQLTIVEAIWMAYQNEIQLEVKDLHKFDGVNDVNIFCKLLNKLDNTIDEDIMRTSLAHINLNDINFSQLLDKKLQDTKDKDFAKVLDNMAQMGKQEYDLILQKKHGQPSKINKNYEQLLPKIEQLEQQISKLNEKQEQFEEAQDQDQSNQISEQIEKLEEKMQELKFQYQQGAQDDPYSIQAFKQTIKGSLTRINQFYINALNKLAKESIEDTFYITARKAYLKMKSTFLPVALAIEDINKKASEKEMEQYRNNPLLQIEN